jgi:hypothetical protein
MAGPSDTKEYEAKIIHRFGDQWELEPIIER